MSSKRKRGASTKDEVESKRPKVSIPDTLTPSQKQVIEMARTGRSFFYTGAAGTGKSYVLDVLAEDMRATNGKTTVFVTASTGMAASSIGGTTLHSYTGLGLCNETPEVLVEKLLKNKSSIKAKRRWEKTKVLIIDECSMISPELFSKLDIVARNVRGILDAPFGGIQVILCGDFFQLPPVIKNTPGSAATIGIGAPQQQQPSMIFETKTWKELIGNNIVVLKEIQRQKDPKFIKLLTELRFGNLSKESLEIIEERRKAVPSSTEGMVRLFPTKLEADNLNKLKLQYLDPSTQKTFSAVDRGDQYQISKLKDTWSAPSDITLRIGCNVMYIYNVSVERGIVNGTTGKVIGYFGPEGYPIVQTINGDTEVATPKTWEVKCGNEVLATRSQVPLILAYAITTHKSQGMTISLLQVNLNGTFEHGQAYVALSRASSLEGLYVNGTLPQGTLAKPHPKVLEWWLQTAKL